VGVILRLLDVLLQLVSVNIQLVDVILQLPLCKLTREARRCTRVVDKMK
jgi:hypothetical protein